MAACRRDRDAILAASSPWAWRSTRQTLAKKAREQLECTVVVLIERVARLEQRDPVAPCQPDVYRQIQNLQTYIEDLRATMADKINASSTDLSNINAILSARMDGIHGKMERVAAAHHAQNKELTQTTELLSGQIISMSTALDQLPGEQLIDSMVLQAKDKIDATIDKNIGRNLDLYDKKVQKAMMELKQYAAASVGDVNLSLSQQVLEVDALKNNTVRRGEVEALMVSLSDSMTQNVMRNTRVLLEDINRQTEARMVMMEQRMDALGSLVQDSAMADLAVESLMQQQEEQQQQRKKQLQLQRQQPAPVSASASTKASINYSKFDWINDESSDDDRPQWVQARDGPKR